MGMDATSQALAEGSEGRSAVTLGEVGMYFPLSIPPAEPGAETRPLRTTPSPEEMLLALQLDHATRRLRQRLQPASVQNATPSNSLESGSTAELPAPVSVPLGTVNDSGQRETIMKESSLPTQPAIMVLLP
eukprot:RCo053170